MRDTIIGTLEGILYLLIIASTVMGFAVGGAMGGIMSMATNPFGGGGFSGGGALLGAIFGFVGGVANTGVIFVMLEIKDLLKSQAGTMEAQRREQ